MENKSIYQKLIEIQAELNVPKDSYNSFGKYNYRNCEDILEAAKPICKKHGLILLLSDTIELIGSRFYVKATATITDGKETVSAQAFAREDEIKKGMDGSQITGAASSYARKYALGGLLAIDNNKDADTDEYTLAASGGKPKAVVCPVCHKEIQGTTAKNGAYWSPADILSRYKMCGSCYTLAKKAEVKNDER